MPYPTRDLQAGLLRKGFQPEETHHHYFRFIVDGILTSVRSPVGGHSRQKYKDLPDYLLSKIKRGLYFDSVEQLIRFAECPMSEGEYRQMLYAKGVIELPPEA